MTVTAGVGIGCGLPLSLSPTATTISAFMANYGGDYGNAVIKRTWWDDLVEWEANNHKDFPADNPDRDYSQHHSFGGGF